MSDAAKQKLSEAHKGTKKPWAGKYKRTPEQKAAASERMKKLWAENRELIIDAVKATHTGKHVSDETRQKISEKYKLRSNYRGGEETKKERRNFYQQRRENKKRSSIGDYSIDELNEIFEAYGQACPSCLKRCQKKTIDHIISLSSGGTNWPINLQPLCARCNSSKNYKCISYVPADYYNSHDVKSKFLAVKHRFMRDGGVPWPSLESQSRAQQ